MATTIRQFPRARANTQDTDTQYSDIYNNIYIRAREDIKSVCEVCFVHQLGYWPSTAAREQLQQLQADGASEELICAVLEYTAQNAPRPTWAYARTVLRKQLAAGVRTAEAFNEACAAFYAARTAAPAYTPGYYKAPQKRVQEQQYQQRQYDPAELDAIPADLLEQAQGG